MEQKPTPEEFQRICPGLEPSFIDRHLSSLDGEYFQSFESEKIAEHATLLSQISGKNPWMCSIEEVNGNGIACTILAYDYPAVFSMITGLLSATGFNIVSGRIFTYARHTIQEPPASSTYSRHRRRRPPKAVFPKRKIIDHFTGSLIRDISFSTWKNQFLRDLNELFHTLDTGERENIERARLKVNERVVQALSGQTIDALSMLYPVVLGDFEIGTMTTRLLIEAEDTPFFLYTLSNALSLHDISIEQVRIRTRGDRVEDTIEFSDLSGKAVTDREKLNRIRISVLFTKQFTYFLSNAPDPYNAFKRFENMIQEIGESSSQGFLESFLKEPAILQDLARLLGASDFLWTDFLRNQYEAILPMLEQGTRETEFSHSSTDLPEILGRRFSKDGSRKEEIRILNQFKDREIYLIDLDHILLKNLDFQFLSNKLTALAETVINTAVALSWKHLKKRFGIPVTVAGLDAKFAVMGLGKLGGAALGYASDIELLFIYSDNGETDGKERVSNSDFFERLFRESVNMIQAKREGIFHVDLRLRPFGSKGPLACSLENFIRYFGKGGSAHSYERLALIRMRSIGGDYELGRRIERIRDEIIYASQDFDVTALKELRQKQFAAKSKPGKLNAKFSPGGLVDLEYTVQILQCIHGKDHASLRTPEIHIALEELAKAGVMSAEEAQELTDTYYFFRTLINGLRMLRGNAKDLFLPDLESEEYQHLARRTGYTEQGNWVPPAQQLHLEFEARAATIRVFVESYIGRDSLPGPPAGNAADLVLSSAIPEELKKKILKSGGVVNTERGYTNLKALAGEGERKTLFARLAILAWDILNKTPDPDMALNNWERFIHSISDPADHYRQMLSQPKRLEILLDIFAGSQFLADTLEKNPGFLAWVTDPGHLHTVRSISAMKVDISRFICDTAGHEAWFDGLRKFRRRETLRIGTRDICLKKPIREIVTELSNLAKAVLQQALIKEWERFWNGSETFPGTFVIFALGKLGGGELNYSSDIDLLGVSVPGPGWSEHAEKILFQIMEALCRDLSDHTTEGYVYRVDLRLRPYGRSGPIVISTPALLKYYRENAALWEHQALLRLTPVAGNLEEGSAIAEELKSMMPCTWDRTDVVNSIDTLRSKTVLALKRSVLQGLDVKNGEGGLRDIEFLVQGLQLIHCSSHPGLLTGNTMDGLCRLGEHGILPASVVDHLMESYLYLRRVEHFIQIYDDRQTHMVPRDPRERKALHKRLEGNDSQSEDLLEKIERMMASVRKSYETYLINTV